MPLTRQKTIEKPVTVEGRGLFSGEQCRLRFVPAAPNSGIAFVCGDGPGADHRLAADVAHVVKRARRTTLANGNAGVETVEHVLSAVWGLGIDNLMIEVTGRETPSLDGSAASYVEALRRGGITEQEAPKNVFVIDEPVAVSAGDAMLAALPGGSGDCLDILYDLDYGNVPSIGRQVLAFRLGKDDYASQIAPSRTFLLEA